MKRPVKNQPHTVQIPGLGPVVFRRHHLARHYRITVRDQQAVVVTLPTQGSFNYAKAFVLEKTPWIRQILQQQQAHPKHRPNAVKLTPAQKETIKTALRCRLNHLADTYGLSYHQAIIRHQKTLWGSCSRSKNINLNLELHRLPETLQDYVMLHELVHTRHPHHGPAFWKALIALLPNAKQLDQQLKTFQPNHFEH